MDNEQAKLILAAYRLDGRDAQDPFFADALRQSEMDPELRHWLADLRAFDERMARALGSVNPPAAGPSITTAAVRMTRRRPKTRTWFWPLAMAASIAIAATVSTLVVRRSDRIDLPQSLSTYALAGYLAEHHASIGLMNPDYPTLVSWIKDRDGPVPENLPAALAQLPVLGCQTWKTNHGKVSLVCFTGAENEMLHLYVFDSVEALPDKLPDRVSPRIVKHGMWAMASWQDEGRGYVLGVPTEGDPEAAIAPFVNI